MKWNLASLCYCLSCGFLHKKNRWAKWREQPSGSASSYKHTDMKRNIAGSSASKRGAQNEFDTSKSKTDCSVPFASLFSYLKAEGCARLGEGSESGDSGTPATHHYSLVIVSHGLNFSKGLSLSCCFVGPIFPLSRSVFAILLFSSPTKISSIFWSLVQT